MNCYVRVYGCQMNAADSHLVAGLLSQAGINQVEQSSSADAVVLLTCSVRQNAEDRARGFARTMRGEGRKVILAGCMGSLRGEELVRAGIADHVVGPDEYRLIPSLILDNEVNLVTPEDLETYADLLPSGISPVTASVPIMRGCGNFCSYCVVPFARGPERSLPLDAVERQVLSVIEQGAREITLLGQNVLAYRHNGMGFVDVLERVSGIDGVERLSFLTSHPRDLSRDMIARMSRIPNLLHFFHLPLQSASDRVLVRMNRGYDLSSYEEKIAWVREAFPDVYLTTDLMVGFPGETEADFGLTLDAVDRIGFDFAYMFAYSERPGTGAAVMAGKVSVAERRRRLSVLIQYQNRHTRARTSSLVGRKEEIFVTAPAPRGGGAMLAQLKNSRPVILKQTARLGELINARLVGVSGWTLLAEPVAKEAV